MSPLIIVGILISTALADVSHVLLGSAHPPPHPSDINSLSGPKTAFETGNPQDFWWMASNSPLKASYDYYKKCSSKGNCLPPINVVSEGAQITKSANLADANFGPINVNKNPFLNGEYQTGSVSSSASSSGCTACSAGSKSSAVAAFHTGTKIDVSKNPFLNGQIATAGNGERIESENGFLGVQPKKPGFATSHPLSNKKPFATAPPDVPQSFVLKGIECKGEGYVCVATNFCKNGVVNKNGEGHIQVRGNVQYCNANTEACCRLENNSERPPFDIVVPSGSGKGTLASNINDLVDVSFGKSSVTGSPFKFSGGAGSSPGQIQVLTDQSSDVKPQIYHVGESGSQSSTNTIKSTRDITPSATSVFPSTVDYSNVQIGSDIRFASTIRGPAYLPPIGGPTPPSKTPDLEVPSQPGIITYQPSIPTTPRPIQTTPRLCPSGTFLTSSGICESPTSPAPICPYGTIQRSDGSCVRPTPPPTPRPCPPGTLLSVTGTCEAPKPPTPSCPFGTILKADGSCERPIIPSTPRPCPPGTILAASGSCEAPAQPRPTCPFGTIQIPDGTCERPPSTPRPCPPGTFLTVSGLCEAPKPPPSCPLGSIQRFDGSCEKPRIIPTPKPCPFGTFLTASGLCESPKTPTPRPSCPPGTFQSLSGACEYPTVSSTTIGYEYSKSCPPGTFKTYAGLCEQLIVTTPRPQCPPGTYLTPSGNCETPTRPSTSKPPPRPFETTIGRDYLPPVTPTQYVPTITQKPHLPSITPEKPFQPSATPQKPQVTSPRPFQSSITPERPFQPSITPRIPSITTQKPYYPSVTTPRPYQPPVTTQRPYQSSTRPSPFFTTPTAFTPVIQCQDGLVPGPKGSCIPKTSCPTGYKLSASGAGCEHFSTRPTGPPVTLSPTPYPRQPCSPGQILSQSGSCIYALSPSTIRPISCLPGQKLSSTGKCEYHFPTDGYEYSKPTTSKPLLSCAQGQILSPSGSCIYSSQPPSKPQSTPRPQPFPKPSCGSGQVPSPSGFGCVYPSSPSTLKSITCSPGQKLSSTGVCQYSTPTQGYEYPKPTVPTSISCGSGQILTPSGSCVYSSQPPLKPVPSPKPSCGFGQVLSPSGTCTSQSTPIPQPFPKPSCGSGQVPSPSGFGCVYPPSPSTPRPIECSPGQKLSPSGVCQYPAPTQGYEYPKPTVPTSISCGPGQILTPSGSCVNSSQPPLKPVPSQKPSCGFGQVLSPSGSCTSPSQSTPRPQPFPRPSCGSGQVPSPSGFGCVYPPSPSTPRPIECSPGQKLSPSGVCQYPTPTQGYEYPKPTVPTSISCGPGQILTPSGSCVNSSQPPLKPVPSPKPSCGFGQVLSPSGTCTSQSTLRPQPFPKPSCGSGQVPSPSGFGCVYPPSPSTPRPIKCPPGQKLSPSGVCQYSTPTQGYEYPKPTTPAAVSCGPGQILTPSGSCVYSSQPPSKPTPSSEPTCGFGQVLSPSGSCTFPSQSTPRPQPFPRPSCGSGQVPSPSGFGCIYPSSPSTPRPEKCSPGQKLSPSGVCQYPTPTQGYEYPKPTTPTSVSCGPGQILTPSGSCVYSSQPPIKPSASPEPSCGFGQVLSSSGSCVYPSQSTPRPQNKPSCGSGQVPSPSGFGCVYPPSSSTSKPTCPPGQLLSDSGLCQYPTPTQDYEYPKPTTSKPSSSCKPGQIPSPSGFGCINRPFSSTPRPIICPQGQKLSSSGTCENTSSTQGYEYPKPSTPFCGPGQTLSPSGSCIYSSQSTIKPRPSIKPSCQFGQILSSSGKCIYPSEITQSPRPSCGPGQVLSSSGIGCEYPTTPKPTLPGLVNKPSVSCPFGTKLSSITNECITGSSRPTSYEYPKPTPSFSQSTVKPSCKPGQILGTSGICIYLSLSTSQPKPPCGTGQILSPSGFCTYPSQPTLSTYPSPKPICRPGQIPSDSGVGCIYPPTSPSGASCPFGAKLSPITNDCITSPSRPTTGYEYPKPSTPFEPIQSTIRPSTSSQCSFGQVLSASGVCIYPLKSTPVPQPGASSPCGPGQILSQSGTCIFSSRPTPKPIPSQTPSCGPGQILSPFGVCIYHSPSTLRPQPSPKPNCGPGQVLSSSGFCTYQSTPSARPSEQPSCEPGQVLSSTGLCIYASRPTLSPIPQPSPSQSTPTPSPIHTTGYEYPIPSTSFTPSYISPSTIRPPPKQCAPGQILSTSGSCIYSSKQTPSPRPSSPPSCGPGQVLSPFGSCTYSSHPTPSPIPSCGPGQILSISGTCIYSSQPTPTPAPGYDYSKPQSPFVPSYQGPSTTRPMTLSQCSPGQILSPSGSCIYPSKPTPSCNSGQVLSPSGICIYPSRPKPTPGPSQRPSCAPGQLLSPSGSCIFPSHSTQGPFSSSGPSCGPGQELSSSGLCIYPSQSTLIPKPTYTPLCGPGQILSSFGSCTYSSQPSPKPSCNAGQVLSPSGSCIYPSQSTPSFPGTTLTPTSKQCPFGSKPSAFGSGCEYPRPTTPKPTPGPVTGYDYPKPSTPFEPKPQCPLGTRLGPSGSCERPSLSTTTPRYDIPTRSPGISKQCPPGSQLSPSGFCEQTSSFPSHPSVASTTPGYEYPKKCPPGTIKTLSGSCEDSKTTQIPQQCPLGTKLSYSGSCDRIPVHSSQSPNVQCPPGTTLGPTGSCERLPQQTPKPQCPFGARLGPSGSCEHASSKLCPPGTYKTPSGDCQKSQTSTSTPGYEYSKQCPPGTFKAPSGECITPQGSTCPPGSLLSPSGICQYPSPTPSIPGRSTDTNNQFTPSYPTKKPYRPTTTTPRPNPADGYHYDKPTPTFGYPSSTLIPNSNSINQIYALPPTTRKYLPPDESSEGTVRDTIRIPHTSTTERPDNTIESENRFNPVSIPSTRQPPSYNGEQNDAPPVGCAAALKCVQEIYCTPDGFVSPVPVVLTKDQEILRVPTTVCQNEETGIIGKCCRDPNYKDPWPSANLVNGVDDGQYKEDNLYGQRGIGNNRLTRSSNVTNSGSRPVRNSNSPQINQGGGPTCGERNYNTKPLGPGPIDANFAEYPWQAMILRDSNRSLLCGGAIIRRNAVLTAAHCVEGLDTSDVLIKGGEWKLGIDEEPLPFQIVKVAAILVHPGYKAGSYENDLAVLVLKEKLRPAKNVGAICLPEPNQIPTSNCVATGWGKRILQLHAKGAIMHHINVNVMDSQQCQQALERNFQNSVQNYNPNTLCGFSDIDQCKVDYGSALACSDDQGRYILSGIYAWDTGCKQEGQIGGYVAPDVEWIDSTLAKSLKDLKKLEKEYLLKRRV